MPCCGRPVFATSPARWARISTRCQFRQLCDRPRTVYLAFDADANGSGQQASQQLALRLRAQGICRSPRLLPDGHDPNSFFVQGGDARTVPVSPGGRSAMKFRVHLPADLRQRTESGSCRRTNHRPRGRLDQSLPGPRIRPPPGRTRPCASTLTTCCTLSAGGRVFITPATLRKATLPNRRCWIMCASSPAQQPRPSGFHHQ